MALSISTVNSELATIAKRLGNIDVQQYHVTPTEQSDITTEVEGIVTTITPDSLISLDSNGLDIVKSDSAGVITQVNRAALVADLTA